ncbi:MAG: stage II sporulation protein M [Deltaproteobacteria bacterium]|nr:stage II sporulation protein M [Deltaproteobacteria bacterium]
MLDVQRFIQERRSAWQRLEELLTQIERQGMKALPLEDGRTFVRLYRATSSHLVQARAAGASAEVTDYLNALVARAYAEIYRAERPRLRRIWTFYKSEFPRLVRAERRAVAVAAAIFFGAALFGFVAVALDTDARFYLLPDQHMHLDPSERVKQLEAGGKRLSAAEQAAFSSFLFTHNIQVTFLAFALGISFGLGTGIVLFYNGLMLGSLCAHYHMKGVATFFYAWILPHGVPELTAIILAAAAGLRIGYALISPGRFGRGDALRAASGRAVRMIVGIIPILVVAGLIEGTISQIHPPDIAYGVKLAFAAGMAVLLGAYLLLAGRKDEQLEAAAAAAAATAATSATPPLPAPPR